MGWNIKEIIDALTCNQIPTNALGFMSVILLGSDSRHFSAIHVATFRVLRTRKQIQFCVKITPQLKAI